MPSVIKSIQTYGENITVINDDDTVLARAFIEPLRYRNKIYIGGGYRNLGMKHSEKYLYVGIPDIPLVENKTIIERIGIKIAEQSNSGIEGFRQYRAYGIAYCRGV